MTTAPLKGHVRNLAYTGHHNAGPLHLAADVAVIIAIAGTVGLLLMAVALIVVLVAIVLD
jgi:hypothetical protein